MKIYLVHNGPNYESRGDGYVMALRAAEHRLTLYSFHFTNGETLPIDHENLSRLQHEQVVDEYRVRAQPAGRRDAKTPR